jgi:hypothetical protein
MDVNQKRVTLRTIEQKISRAREYVQSLDADISEITEQRDADEYRRKKDEHDQAVQLLEGLFRDANRSIQTEEQARAQGLTPQDLMNRATNLQDEQKKSLDNALFVANQIQTVGAGTLEDIAHQREVLDQTSKDLTAMDSELERAKKIMKQMLTRAAGDNCVRLLAILVILSVVAVVIVEAVSPGAVKKNSDAWFNNDEIVE